jgi:predicted esterase
MNGIPRGWVAARVPFTEEHPAWMRDGPRPEAPILVLCHGMSQGPEAWFEMAPRLLALPAHMLLPAGPYPHEVRTGGTIRIGRAWYLYDGGPDRFRETVDRSERWLLEVIARAEAERGWKPARRVLVGYSQGAYFSYVAALRHQNFFSHLIAVAGRLKEEFLVEELAKGGPLHTLVVHGERDNAVDSTAALRSHRLLLDAGYRAEQLLVPTGHAFTPEIDERTARWIAEHALTV